MAQQSRAGALMAEHFRAEDCRLSLSCMDIDGKVLSEIVKLDISKVKTLDIYGNEMGDEAVRVFINAQWQTLQMVYLGANNLTGIGLNQFTFYNFPVLSLIDISENNIGNKGIALLVRSELHALTALICQQCGIEREGTNHFLKAKWPKLQSLDLSNNPIQNGLSLFHLNNWRSLNELILMGIGQDTINAMNIMISPFRNLKYLNFERNQPIQAKTLVKIIQQFIYNQDQVQIEID